MTYTLANLTYRTARELDIVYEGTATGGSDTTLIDTNQLDQANDYWNDGTVWILEDAGGAGAARHPAAYQQSQKGGSPGRLRAEGSGDGAYHHHSQPP